MGLKSFPSRAFPINSRVRKLANVKRINRLSGRVLICEKVGTENSIAICRKNIVPEMY